MDDNQMASAEPVVHTEPLREMVLLRNESIELKKRAETASFELQEREAAMAKLLDENRSLVTEMEHLRAVLSQKDELIKEAREAPDTILRELAQLRQHDEEATAKLQRVEAERDAAQTELLRKKVTLEQAEEELRRLRHQHDQLERVAVAGSDAGSELTQAVKDKAAIAEELGRTREKLELLEKQLDSSLCGVEHIVVELGVKVYALRAALARTEPLSKTSTERSAIYDAFDDLLAHLDDGNLRLRNLRKLVEPAP